MPVSHYLKTAREVAGRSGSPAIFVLARMLLSKAISGLSSVEYGAFDLHGKPLRSHNKFFDKKRMTALLDSINPASAIAALHDKTLFHSQCRSFNLPTAELIACIGQANLHAAHARLVDASALHGFLMAELPIGRYIFKPSEDGNGSGVFFLAKTSEGWLDIAGNPVDLAAWLSPIMQRLKRQNYLIERFCVAHHELARLWSAKALGTLRVVTYRKGETVTLIYALLRLPSGGNTHDNFSNGASGNLISAVDCANGSLGPAVGRRAQGLFATFEKFASNPDNGQLIVGCAVPFWQDVISLVSQASKAFEHIPLIGWDVAVTDEGPILIEGNHNPDPHGIQILTGKGMAEILSSVIA